MSIEHWWPQLNPSTQKWLIENNGDVLPGPVLAEIAAAGGPATTDSWWPEQPDTNGMSLPDEAVDWIEAMANGEASSPS